MLVLHLLCPTIVLRAILKKGWLDDAGRITSTAFVYDPIRDPDGLSVNIAACTDVPTWLGSFRASFGADSLHCGRIRDLDLEVGQTEEDIGNNPAHAVIAGLPSPEDDPQRAEDLATELVNLTRSVDRTRRRQ